MAVAPEPYLSACLTVLHRTVLFCRACGCTPEFPNAHTADLMDAVHNIPWLIRNWEHCDVDFLRTAFLGAYEEKWLDQGGLALCQIFDDVVAGRDPGV